MEHSPLQRLPPEIRNRMSELALTHPAPLRIRYKPLSEKDTEGHRRLVIEETSGVSNYNQPSYLRALTNTCKQHPSETKGLFFAVNNFEVVLDQWYDYTCPTEHVRHQRSLEQLHDVLRFFSLAKVPHIRCLKVFYDIGREAYITPHQLFDY